MIPEGKLTGDTLAAKNNNPGNVKFPVGHKLGGTGVDKQGHSIYETVQDGLNALNALVSSSFYGGNSRIYSPDMSLHEFGYAYTGGETPNKGAAIADALQEIGVTDPKTGRRRKIKSINPHRLVPAAKGPGGYPQISIEDLMAAIIYTEDKAVYDQLYPNR